MLVPGAYKPRKSPAFDQEKNTSAQRRNWSEYRSTLSIIREKSDGVCVCVMSVY